LGKWELFSYDLYVINGRTRLAQHQDDNDDKGVGARLKIEIPVPGIERLGVIYSAYQDDSSTAAVGSGFMRNQTHAVSLEFGFKDLDFHFEYANGTRGGSHMDAFHAMMRYTLLNRVIPFLRYEFLEPNLNAGRDRSFVTGGGVQIHLLPGELFTASVKFQFDRVSSEHGSSDKDYAENNYNRFFAGVGAGF
jgi:hypothetical protein